MTFELILILVSSISLVLIYTARMKTADSKTFLFSENFLNKADEYIFDFIKFVFKLYTLMSHNISSFISHIPHKVVHSIYKISHIVAQKSSVWVEKVRHTHTKKKDFTN